MNAFLEYLGLPIKDRINNKKKLKNERIFLHLYRMHTRWQIIKQSKPSEMSNVRSGPKVIEKAADMEVHTAQGSWNVRM